jgi:hypothetical protein
MTEPSNEGVVREHAGVMTPLYPPAWRAPSVERMEA